MIVARMCIVTREATHRGGRPASGGSLSGLAKSMADGKDDDAFISFSMMWCAPYMKMRTIEEAMRAQKKSTVRRAPSSCSVSTLSIYNLTCTYQ
jgi:hypothetical protein